MLASKAERSYLRGSGPFPQEPARIGVRTVHRSLAFEGFESNGLIATVRRFLLTMASYGFRGWRKPYY
jgi:hypothetical protein